MDMEKYYKVTSVDGVTCYVPRSAMSDKMPIKRDIQSFRKIKCLDGGYRWFSSSELCLVKSEPNNIQNAVDNVKVENTLNNTVHFSKVVDGVLYFSEKEYRKQKKRFDKSNKILGKTQSVLDSAKEQELVQEPEIQESEISIHEYYNRYMDAYTKRKARSAVEEYDEIMKRYNSFDFPILVSGPFRLRYLDYTDDECDVWLDAPSGAHDLKNIENEIDKISYKYRQYGDYSFNSVKEFTDRLIVKKVIDKLNKDILSRLSDCIIMDESINDYDKSCKEYKEELIRREKEELERKREEEYQKRKEEEWRHEQERLEAEYRRNHPEEYDDENEW